MPAFTFEKIAPPSRETTPTKSTTSLTSKPVRSRGLVGHMIDRLTVTRIKRQESKQPALRKKG